MGDPRPGNRRGADERGAERARRPAFERTAGHRRHYSFATFMEDDALRSHHKLWAALAVIGLVLALMFLGAGHKRTSVPWLLGLSEAQAEKRLEDRALEAEVLKRPRGTHRLSKRYRVEGQIVFQDYRRGMVLPADSTVRVVVYQPRRAGEQRRRD